MRPGELRPFELSEALERTDLSTQPTHIELGYELPVIVTIAVEPVLLKAPAEWVIEHLGQRVLKAVFDVMREGPDG